MRIKKYLMLVSFFMLVVTIIPSYADNNPTTRAKQLVVVISENWDAATGILRRFERPLVGNQWRKVGGEIEVNLGANGMAWGSGLHTNPINGTNQPVITQEGLKRSPAGAFDIPVAFGKDSGESWGVKLPYSQISKTLYCSCDISYNRIVDSAVVGPEDWDRGESMQHYVDDNGLYNYGAVIAHNYSPATYGRGCCFFIHVWRGPGKPTAGCTAMASENTKELVSWLDPQKNPVLVQFPKETYSEYKPLWGLPAI